jgi:hypothetical protein
VADDFDSNTDAVGPEEIPHRVTVYCAPGGSPTSISTSLVARALWDILLEELIGGRRHVTINLSFSRDIGDIDDYLSAQGAESRVRPTPGSSRSTTTVSSSSRRQGKTGHPTTTTYTRGLQRAAPTCSVSPTRGRHQARWVTGPIQLRTTEHSQK